MSKLYNIIDKQLGEYYREGVTLGEAKEYAIIFMERSMLEQAEATPEDKVDDEKLLSLIESHTEEKQIADDLLIFDYELEEVKE